MRNAFADKPLRSDPSSPFATASGEHDRSARTERAWRIAVPSWVMSVLLHAGLLVLLGVTLQLTPEGAAEEALRSVGIVLKKVDRGEEQYQGEDDVLVEAQTADVSAALADLNAEQPPSDFSDALPSERDWLGTAEPGASALDAGANVTGDALPRTPRGGKARTEVFGVEGEGTKFVYVFDRSGSMERTLGPSPLAAAKRELLASLETLGDTHQFQIIMYNQQPLLFTLPGQPARMLFANGQNKQDAERFLGGVAAVGATTGREAALLMALRLAPDVVFFLSDADNPLTPRQLNNIRKRNSGRTAIHTIEFDRGPARGGVNFLKQLSAENGGRYIYVDIGKL